jgi:hypothetical protein
MADKEPFAVFFPPRILFPDFSKGDHNAILDDIKDRYLDEGIVVVDEDGLNQAQKIVQYASAFPDVTKNPV